MQTCPCCGTKSNLQVTSAVRHGVLICGTCHSNTRDYLPQWYVDDKKPTKALKDYLKVRNDYVIAVNFSDDRMHVAKCKEKLDRLTLQRVKKHVVLTEHSDGVSALFESSDLNLALAYALGWLGKNYNHTGGYSWVSMHGSVLWIEGM